MKILLNENIYLGLETTNKTRICVLSEASCVYFIIVWSAVYIN